MRWVAYLVLVALVLVQWPLWFGKGGWLRVWDLQRQIAIQRSHNNALVARNNVLAAEVRSLKEGREAIEERARQELHMTRGDEVFFQLVPPKADGGGPAAPASLAPSK